MNVQRTKTVVLTLAMALLVVLTMYVPRAAAQATPDGEIAIEVVVIGDDVPGDLTFTLNPLIDGCADGGPATVSGAGGATLIEVATLSTSVVDGPITFSSADFVTTPLFSDVQTFAFELTTGRIQAGAPETEPGLTRVEYSVMGALSGTPSGFPAFNLVRDMNGREFYDQMSDLSITIDAAADVSDGLQISELSLFELDAREVDTGRYHPPTLVLRNDGTGTIANSNNMGGVNPASLQVVDVQVGDEYVTDLSFDATMVTIAQPESCMYGVRAEPVAGYTVTRTTGTPAAAGGTVVIELTQDVALTCDGEVVTIDMNTGATGMGTDGDDVVLGTPGNDVIQTGLGNDVVCAGEGNDIVLAGPGDDRAFGEAGDDKLYGEAGADELNGADGNDVIHGNRGDDRLIGGPGEDRIFGYAGDDEIVGGPDDDKLHGNFGNDTIFGGLGDDRIFGYGDNDSLFGSQGNDTIRGNFGDDVIRGGQGDDLLIGSAGNDRLDGEPGNDDVQGSSGNDTLDGGAGNDILDGGIGTDVCDGSLGTDMAMRCQQESNIE